MAEKNNEKKAEEKLSLEERFEQLDSIVEELESNDISLEKSFELYKKGMDYLKECSDEISSVEKKVMQLKDNGETDEF